ncbi:choline ABC transporter permease subunit [Roseibium suaedae]|uniref:Glycine betaine/proline transport system permease protein n=1 Tax=Roseibium suaedae TaxID=735517 RepID=A0A1M7ABJ6_9HYPH|nr:choline ABC transporter permease subunit [Roseibium suaedae]SHL40050.1 glycine betaine/proline transport system permease protein [Roseibium suaedae]
MDWLIDHKIPIGAWAKALVDWLTDNAYWVFDGISVALESMIDGILYLLQAPHPLVIVALATGLAYLVRRSLSFPAFVAVALLLIINQGYWTETTETLALVIASTFVCVLIGVPIGVAAAHRPRLYLVMRPILDMMQTIPTFVYLIPALILFGLGMVPGLVATVIFAIPAPIRLTQLGVSTTPTHLLEAGQAFGATKSQILWKIELPYALPQIMAGLTQTIMLSLSMVVIAGMVGAPGLGTEIVRALGRADIAKGFEVGVAIVLIAIILDRFFQTRDGKGAQG